MLTRLLKPSEREGARLKDFGRTIFDWDLAIERYQSQSKTTFDPDRKGPEQQGELRQRQGDDGLVEERRANHVAARKLLGVGQHHRT